MNQLFDARHRAVEGLAEDAELVSRDADQRNYLQSCFPNAKIVADQFQGRRLRTPSLLKKPTEISGTRGDLRANVSLSDPELIWLTARLRKTKFKERQH